MIERTEECFDIKPERLAADTAYGSGANLNWLVTDKKIAPHIRVIDKSKRDDGTFSRLFPESLLQHGVIPGSCHMKAQGISSPGTHEAMLMWPCKDGEREWRTILDWTCH
jgi:hypothetical protein